MEKIRVGIRTDAAPKIGMGHVMRCLAIAEGLTERGMQVTFITANHDADGVFAKYPVDVIVLDSDYREMSLDAERLAALGIADRFDFMIADSYFADDRFLEYLESCLPSMFIDGLMRTRAELSVILNYNAAADPAEYERRFEGKKSRLLIGTDYVPLRREFRESAPRIVRRGGDAAEPERAGGKPLRRIPETARNILLTTGAADNLGIVPEFIRLFSELFADTDAELHVAVGGLFRNTEEVRKAAARAERVVLHEGVKSMRELMGRADLAVTAAGTTVYELLSQGVPTVAFPMTDIQRNVRILRPAIAWAEDVRREEDPERLSREALLRVAESARSLTGDAAEREKLACLAAERIDGEGVLRIADAVKETVLRRRAPL